MEVEIDKIATFGTIADVPPYQLPPEAWTTALNMRARDNGLESLMGWAQVFGTPTVAPHFLFPISGTALNFWIYTSLTKAYVFDGATHTNITRQSGGVDVDYTAAATEDWNGTLLGGIPILNNNADVPQFWPTQSAGTKLANLTNWPAALRAKVIRAFGPFLVAFNLTDAGTNLPHTAQWSHPAVPGAVPSSWDYTSTILDAGRKDFPDVQSGILIDALPFGQTMFVYKESSTWKMRFIGGRFIFDFGESAWLTTSGILAARCVCNTGDGTKQVVVTQDDIIWHNGNTVNSILDKRQRKTLFQNIDTAAFGTSFLFDNPTSKEIWFCYPGPGSTQPDRAMVMNYSHGNVWPVTEADGITFRNAAVGGIESPNDEDWEANEELWDDDTGPWSDLQRRRVLLASPANTKIYNMDSGTTRDGVAINTTLQRIGQSITGKTRDGDPVVDFQKMMMWTRIWPKIQGGPVNIRFASQQLVDGPVAWSVAETHNPTVRAYSDPGPATGRANGVEFTGSGVQWRIDGYKLNVEPLGEF
jgi:hypothetical protein